VFSGRHEQRESSAAFFDQRLRINPVQPHGKWLLVEQENRAAPAPVPDRDSIGLLPCINQVSAKSKESRGPFFAVQELIPRPAEAELVVSARYQHAVGGNRRPEPAPEIPVAIARR
jgi:hypothetical protein